MCVFLSLISASHGISTLFILMQLKGHFSDLILD